MRPLTYLAILVLTFLPTLTRGQEKKAEAEKKAEPKENAVRVIRRPVMPAVAIQNFLQPEAEKDALPADPKLRDEKLLRDAGLPADGPKIVEYFRKRTLPEANPKLLGELVQKLGDVRFSEREKAFEALASFGAAALPGLKDGLNANDTEIRQRAEDLRKRIEANAEPTLQQAAARMIARLKPDGAAQVILDYLPIAPDRHVGDELCKALGAIAVKGGKLDSVIEKSLDDKIGVRRAAAAEAVIRSKAPAGTAKAKALLKDSDPNVRLRVGLALVDIRESEAIPVLVDLLTDLNAEALYPVEEILVQLADEKSPSVSLGNSEETRKTAHKAWKAWYDASRSTLSLKKLDQVEQLKGHTLICQQSFNAIVAGRNNGVNYQIIEIDMDKKKIKSIDVNAMPVDAQFTRQETVVIAEYQTQRITERNDKGEIVWQTEQLGSAPIGVQRLSNGNTFAVTQTALVEFDREKKKVAEYRRSQYDIVRGRRMRNGDFAFVTNQGQFFRVEPKSGKVVRNFEVAQVGMIYGNIDVLANGGVLVPEFQHNRVAEYSPDGQLVRTFSIQWPNGAQRLPNGNTLVTSYNTRRIVEFDRDGREVWAHMADGVVFNARRR